MRRRALLSLLAAAACGTTVPAARVSSLDGLGAPAGGSAAPISTDFGSDPGGTRGTTSGTTGGAVTAPGATRLPRPGGSGAPQPPALPTKGVTGTAAVITVGIPYIDQGASNAFTSSLGKGLATGDQKAATARRIAQLNSRGGILGRKLVAYFEAVDINSSPGQYQQAACAAFTQDHKVQYVIDIGLGDSFLTCLAKAGVGVISTGNSLKTRAGMARFPGYVQPNAMALDRIAETQAAQFLALGFFGSLTTAKVGILYYDHPEFIAAEAVLERELRARGVSVVARVAGKYVATTDDVPTAVSQMSNAVLKFRSAGVTHVLAVEENAWLTGGFGIAAASQSYYPRYGYTSNEPLGNIAANVPARGLQGALFLGWDPVYDVPSTSELTPAGKACLASFRGEPQDTPNERSALITACESIDFLRATLTAAGRADGAPSLVDGASRLTGYVSAYTFRVVLTRSKRDGVAGYRPGRWDDGCGCFAYTGPLRSV